MTLLGFGKKPRQPDNRTKLQRMGFGALKLSGLALFLSPANVFLTNFLLFHPERDTLPKDDRVRAIKTKYNITWTDEYFQAKDGTKLHGWYLQQPGACKTFLVSHGNAGNLSYRLRIIDALAASGSSIFLYDYRGYGKSDGQPSAEGIVADGIGAYDYLVKQKNIPAHDIVLYGESLGCAVSTNISMHRPVCGIILQSGFATLLGAARDRLPWYKLFPDESFPQRFLDNVTAYTKPHPPLLLMHGKKDWILSPHYSQEIFDSAIEPKQLVYLPNCAHNDVYTQDEKISSAAINSFVTTLISQTVAHNNAFASPVGNEQLLSAAGSR